MVFAKACFMLINALNGIMERNATILVITTGKLTTKALLNVVSIFYNITLFQ